MKTNKKYLLSILCIAAMASFSSAQVQWEKEYIYSNHAVNNTIESARAVIETSDGGYLIGGTAEIAPRTAYLSKISANGDSLWTRYYGASYGNFNGLAKLYRDNDNKLHGVFETLYGRITFVELSETNGDTISSFQGPMGPASGYTYMAHTQLANGDYILSYSQTSSPSSIVKRFTPGNINGTWTKDYASEVLCISSIIQDGPDVVMSGYCGADWWQYNLAVTKLDAANGTVQWLKKYIRNAVWRDHKVGLAKNSNGEYLAAAAWTHNGKLVPSVLRVAASGDSLGISYLDSHNGNPLNLGFCNDLKAFGSGFVASGEIDQNFNDTNGDPQNVGQLALICINNNGEIVSSYAMNQIGPYYNGSVYTGSHAWGLACITTSDEHVLVVGKGNYIAESGGWISAYGDAYMVKIAPESLGLNEHNEFASLNAWPNPSTGKVRIAASEMIDRIVICNQVGAVISDSQPSSSTVDVDLSAAPGVYFYRVYGKNGSSGSGKLMIR